MTERTSQYPLKFGQIYIGPINQSHASKQDVNSDFRRNLEDEVVLENPDLNHAPWLERAAEINRRDFRASSRVFPKPTPFKPSLLSKIKQASLSQKSRATKPFNSKSPIRYTRKPHTNVLHIHSGTPIPSEVQALIDQGQDGTAVKAWSNHRFHKIVAIDDIHLALFDGAQERYGQKLSR